MATPATATPMGSVLSEVITRVAGVFRTLWALAAIIVVFVSGALDDPPVSGPVIAVAAVGWSAFVARMTLRDLRLPRWVAFVDAALFAVLLVAAALLVPTPMIGDGTSWIFTGATVSLLLAGWLLSPAGAMVATAAMVIAYLVGVGLAGRMPTDQAYLQTALLLLLQGILAQRTLSTMRASGRQADQALDRAVATESAVRLEAKHEREQEQQERLLHDRVAATLWQVGGGHLRGKEHVARTMCADSLSALRALAAGRLQRSNLVTMAEATDEAVNWATTAGGLTVVLSLNNQRVHPHAQLQVLLTADDLPTYVVRAVGAALLQALQNVTRHARTARNVTVDLHVAPQRVSVVIADDGIGFTADDVDPAGRGMSSSIIARMEEIGGSARVESKPGKGTRVTLSWIGGRIAEAQPDVGGAALRAYGGGFLRMIAILGLVFHFLSLAALIGLRDDYEHPGLVLMCWLVMLVGGGLLGFGVGRPWMTVGRARIVGAMILAASTVEVISCEPQAVLGFANWAFGDTVWAAAFVAAHLRMREVLSGLALIDLIHVTVILTDIGADPGGLSKMTGILLGNVIVQLGIAAAFAFLRKSTDITSQKVWAASVVVTDRRARAAARRERARKAEQFDETVIRLLESVARGTIDPNDRSVRAEFQAASFALRRIDTLGGAKGGAVDLAELATNAARRGTDVEIKWAENMDRVAPGPRRAMMDLVSRALNHAEPGRALLTVQAGVDLTTRDWQVSRPRTADDAVTITIQFPTQAGHAAVLRDELGIAVHAHGLHLSIDVDVDEPEDEDVDSTSHDVRTAVPAWLAVAYQP
ncbi:sensor histidine kinase [Lentzea sp. NPDC054927]